LLLLYRRPPHIICHIASTGALKRRLKLEADRSITEVTAMLLTRNFLEVPRLLFAGLLIAALATSAAAQQATSSKLGRVDFPTSGSGPAQAHFLRGVAALHSFWYEEALAAFREATQADPDLMMGYWGEAMAHNHPLWAQQDTEAARQVLAKIRDTPKLAPRERAYLNAVKVLYGPGDKLARDLAYAAAMEKIYRDYPDDLEAAAFYALSLLGTVRPGDQGYRRQMQAGALALEVYQKNPDHPGAAHYIIHAFDDPEHAILALPAARRYAEIAPEAHHARHMPSHIFLQLGMWPEAATSNESAWAVSEAWVKRKHLPLNLRDYHSYHWLIYVYLQQGRYGKAEELIAQARQTMKESGRESVRFYEGMAAAFIVDTQRWELAAKLFEMPGNKTEGAAAGGGAGEHAGHGAATKPATAMAPNTRRGQALPQFVRALAAARGALPDADQNLAELRALRQQRGEAGDAYGAKVMEIRELEVAAAMSAAKGNYDEAIALMKKATTLEEELSPPSGPPDLIKPSHELMGELLLRAGRPKEAMEQFKTSLLRQPNRARSLLGAARAAAQSGDRSGAAAAYAQFLHIWAQADAELPELREARDYLGRASTR
jgi:tetratricopeptide (TPR) repeat protein